MRKDYGIFNYHDKEYGLVILFTDKKYDHIKIDGEMAVLYSGDEVVGYKIDNFVRYAKIKYSGIIFLPSPALIDVINSVLANHNLETLEYKTNSGYITKRNGNVMSVYATPGTFLRNEKISAGHFVSNYALYIRGEHEYDLIELDDDVKEGIDFFQMEVK